MNVDETIKEYGYPPFRTKTEDWSEYELSDGTIIRIKAVPLKFLKVGNDYPMNSAVLVTSFAPQELRGEPTTPPPASEEDLKQAVDEVDMKFDTLNEPWNEYGIEGDVTISVKTITTSISSTFIHDPAGEPIYFVNHQMIIKRNPPL